MVVRGRVQNGVVVLENGTSLPEDMDVTVSYPVAAEPAPPRPPRRVHLPFVPSARPGSRPLTAERVAELLDDDDAPA